MYTAGGCDTKNDMIRSTGMRTDLMNDQDDIPSVGRGRRFVRSCLHRGQKALDTLDFRFYIIPSHKQKEKV